MGGISAAGRDFLNRVQIDIICSSPDLILQAVYGWVRFNRPLFAVEPLFFNYRFLRDDIALSAKCGTLADPVCKCFSSKVLWTFFVY